MNDDPGGSTIWALPLLLGSLCLFGFLLAGAVSAVANLVRLERSGIIHDGQHSAPIGALLSRARSVLLSLSIGYFLSITTGAMVFQDVVLRSEITTSRWVTVSLWVGLFLVLILGSVLTKALALARPVGFLGATVWLVWPVFAILRPFTAPLEFVLARLLPSAWALEISPPLSGQEIRDILADDETSALIENKGASWARSIFELGETEIREIMVPRIDMVGVAVDTSFTDAVDLAVREGFTRLPVWETTQDKILGVLHTKDLLAAQARDEEPSVRNLLRPVHFLPESKKIDDALHEFREDRIHLAVVVDEYGGTAGIVTLEDMLEEIVGEIRDEFDNEGELVRRIDATSAVIDPRIDLDDLNEMFEFSLPTEEVDTLGGLLYSLCGKVPKRGDVVDFEGLHFTIEGVDRQRILQVTLRSDQALANPNGDYPEPAS